MGETLDNIAQSEENTTQDAVVKGEHSPEAEISSNNPTETVKSTVETHSENREDIKSEPEPDENEASGSQAVEADGKTKAEKESNTLMSWVKDFLIMIPIVVVLVLIIKVFFFGTYEIPSGSMIDTIEIGDRVISEKISYMGRSPERGDIITFADPAQPTRTLIKRVVATEGETVSLTTDGRVTINGEILDEPYVDGKPSYPLSPTLKTIEYPYTVPEGEVWVMGDNRTESADSRYFGSVPVSSITGHAVCRYWPLNRIGGLE